ncbi:hypothetical protein MSG28_014423 [Choristoneura fumiferana]|uniref:Uncharacterized protein n=1 Tax=Choristoneura fumiferana TaxID=7141 RepID=A0ACC0JRT1_CHOFU|nr:hypothetical protein MSG28_014423 [Choristoneura fumiferana]
MFRSGMRPKRRFASTAANISLHIKKLRFNDIGGCVLPAYPPHGTYTVYNKPAAVPGQVYDFAGLTVTCDPGYGVVGSNTTYCFGGNSWPQPMPQCTPGPRVCNELEPHGTEVVPECNRLFYYPGSVLLNMHCVDGTWDHVAVCQPDDIVHLTDNPEELQEYTFRS